MGGLHRAVVAALEAREGAEGARADGERPLHHEPGDALRARRLGQAALVLVVGRHPRAAAQRAGHLGEGEAAREPPRVAAEVLHADGGDELVKEGRLSAPGAGAEEHAHDDVLRPAGAAGERVDELQLHVEVLAVHRVLARRVHTHLTQSICGAINEEFGVAQEGDGKGVAVILFHRTGDKIQEPPAASAIAASSIRVRKPTVHREIKKELRWL